MKGSEIAMAMYASVVLVYWAAHASTQSQAPPPLPPRTPSAPPPNTEKHVICWCGPESAFCGIEVVYPADRLAMVRRGVRNYPFWRMDEEDDFGVLPIGHTFSVYNVTDIAFAAEWEYAVDVVAPGILGLCTNAHRRLAHWVGEFVYSSARVEEARTGVCTRGIPVPPLNFRLLHRRFPDFYPLLGW